MIGRLLPESRGWGGGGVGKKPTCIGHMQNRALANTGDTTQDVKGGIEVGNKNVFKLHVVP